MRLDRVTRFLATRLLGGGELRHASWDEARRLLESAERSEPCVPDHHFELARLYLERGEDEAGWLELSHVYQAAAGAGARFAGVIAKAEELRLRPQ
jgi:hypothetical protein